MLPLRDDKKLEKVTRNRGIRGKEGETAYFAPIAFGSEKPVEAKNLSKRSSADFHRSRG